MSPTTPTEIDFLVPTCIIYSTLSNIFQELPNEKQILIGDLIINYQVCHLVSTKNLVNQIYFALDFSFPRVI